MTEPERDTVQGLLTRMAYAQIALEQQLPLSQLAEAAASLALPLATTDSPDWYVAASSPEASLLDVAPELRMDDSSAERIDLVRMYAPELAKAEEPVDAESAPSDQAQSELAPKLAPKPAPPAQKADDLSKIELLRELSGLDE